MVAGFLLCERDKLAGDPQRTLHHKLVLVGAPIVIEKSFEVGELAILATTTPVYMELHAYFGCRKNTSTHT